MVVLTFASAVLAGCGLFEPRDPESPGQSGLDFVPATVPSIVISNLRNAIAQKSADNYMRSFSDVNLTGRPFVFVPSVEASSVYPNVRDWSYDDERAYFENLVAKADGFSGLLLVPRDSIIGASEAIYNFDYTFSWQHTDAASFPTSATGNMQVILAPDAGNIWSIHYWADFSIEGDVSWSSFKGSFGN
jgi:hypothetical protein